jgi:glycine dehydrogenase subunit 1
MFKYFPNTSQNLTDMLAKIGVDHLESLLNDIPSSIRMRKGYDLLPQLSEHQLRQYLKQHQGTILQSYRGYGAYEHERPAIVDTLSSRQEFLTSYTPYQPEVAQGTLQYIFEWQSMMTQLTNMEVSNASMYDGPTALAEAMMMAVSQTQKRKIIVASSLLPHVLDVLKTYAHFRNIELCIFDQSLGMVDSKKLLDQVDDSIAGVIFAYPNQYGVIEYYSDWVEAIHQVGGLVISYNDPFTLARLKTPGELGADIACGEAQSLGLPLSFGGPYLGYLTTKLALVRKMPGRICGYTKDANGERGFVLTLQAREQHIRREKANSNICSNQSLLALQATIYCASLGKQGLVAAFDQAYQATHYLVNALIQTTYFSLTFPAPYAIEATLTSTVSLKKLEAALLAKGILFAQLLDDHHCVIYANESRTKVELDQLVTTIKELAYGI